MKKSLVPLASLALLVGLVSLTSCKKEETLGNGMQFRATMESCTSQNGKTTLNGTALEWVSGDQIAIYGTAGRGVYTAIPQTPATTAVFDNVSGETGNSPFRAYYPATLTTDGLNITLPATQTYVANSINEFPMYAESNNEELSFKNLCGVLKLNLTKEGVNISSITVTTATEINGTWSVGYVATNGDDVFKSGDDYSNGFPVLEYVSGGTNSITLECATPQSIAEGKDFYIYLPEGSYSGLQIEMNTNDNRYCVKTANTAINVTRSQYTLITLGSTLQFRPIGSKGGLFTVNADGDQVWFSQGNLQYQASTTTWRFAEHQYDYVGADNENISSTYSGWIDLFGFGTGSNPTLSTTTANPDYSTFVDWGTNAIDNGGNQSSLWRTLDVDEWSYLFYTRTDASLKYGTGNVGGLGGLIILPDSWTTPDGCSFTPGFTTYGTDADWSRNSYNSAQWDRMEAAGAVFLPAAGGRNHGMISGNGTRGYYWSSTHYGLGSAGCVAFASYRFWPFDYWDGAGGCSVRLVRNN